MKCKKIYIENSGCYRRSMDQSQVKKYFELNNCQVITNPKKADQIIYFTCAAIKENEDVSINRIKEIQKKFPGKLIVTGCLPGINKSRLDKIHDGPSITPKNLNDIDKLFTEFDVRFGDVPDANSYVNTSCPQAAKYIWSACFYNSWKNYRLLIKHILRKAAVSFSIRVSWGCLGNCSYCGIRNGIGRLKSKPLEQCLSELDEGVRQGHRLIDLVSDDIGAYGFDTGKDFAELINAVLKRHPHTKILLGDIHPRWLVKYEEVLLPYIKSGRIDEIWCPLQSGSDKILRLMNRGNNAAMIKKTAIRIKKVSPGTFLGAHVICGFPSEMDGDWEQSLQLVVQSGFDCVALFPYSKIEGTRSASMTGHLSREIIQKRLKEAKQYFRLNNVAMLCVGLPAQSKRQSCIQLCLSKLFQKASAIVINRVTSMTKRQGWAS